MGKRKRVGPFVALAYEHYISMCSEFGVYV